MSITSSIMKKFIEAAGERLSGSWVVIGGSVLHLLNVESRQTEDIDLAGPLDATQADILAMMEIAEGFGLPIEAINQAGAFFLHRIANWQNKILKVHQGSKGTIFRPNLELFFELKLGRLSDADVVDCLNYLQYAVEHKELFNAKNLRVLCEKYLGDPLKAARVRKLITAIGSS